MITYKHIQHSATCEYVHVYQDNWPVAHVIIDYITNTCYITTTKTGGECYPLDINYKQVINNIFE